LKAVRWLLGGPRPAELRDHEGRADLRGLYLPDPSVLRDIAVSGMTFQAIGGMLEMRGAKWSSLDLAHARLPNLRFFDSSAEDCRFEKASCRDWRLWNTEVVRCAFEGADLRDSTLGTLHGEKPNTWRDVSFDRADLRNLLMYRSTVMGCTFRDARLDGAKFQQSAIQACVFSGRMTDVLFDGRDLPGEPPAAAMYDVDFSDASLTHVEFRGCRFVDVRMPDTADIWVIPDYPKVARFALTLVAEDSRLEAQMLARILRGELKLPGCDDSVGVFNKADDVAIGGAAFADLAESVLRQAAADVARERG
jgi:uncharacterized protein YjbI with pentapeptide repeats